MIIDTHAHCYWESMLPRIDEIVQSMKDRDVSHAVQIGCDIESSNQAIMLAQRFPGIFYATVGHHPETAQDVIFDSSIWKVGHDEKNNFSIMDISYFEELIIQNRDAIVAVGECGFDFHYLDGSNGGKNPVNFTNLSEKAKEQIENQKKWWLAQWGLAKKYNLPLVIHTRDARNETLDFMINNHIDRAVIHCYSEDPEFARTLMDFSDNIYFAFWWILTYKKSELVQETAKILPLNRILLETDAPFLSPQVVRGTVNEPANTRYVLEKLCELRDESNEEIEKVVYENSMKFYSLGN